MKNVSVVMAQGIAEGTEEYRTILPAETLNLIEECSFCRAQFWAMLSECVNLPLDDLLRQVAGNAKIDIWLRESAKGMYSYRKNTRNTIRTGPVLKTQVTMLVDPDHNRPSADSESYAAFWTFHSYIMGVGMIQVVHADDFSWKMSHQIGIEWLIRRSLQGLCDLGYITLDSSGMMTPTSILLSMYDGVPAN